MKIIGHRGAAGLELENTLASLRLAKELGVDGIEFDVRLTGDRQLVLCHDADLARVSGNKIKIANASVAELKMIKLHNGETVPTLDEALTCVGNTWTIIEVKVDNCFDELLAVIDRHPGTRLTVASFDHRFAAALEKLRPDVSVYLAERTRPTEIIDFIKSAKANGMDLNAWLLNPFTYWLANHNKLEIMLFTVNHPFIARFLHYFYPRAAICTDYPDRMLKSFRAEQPEVQH